MTSSGDKLVSWLEHIARGPAEFLPVEAAGNKIHVAYWKDRPAPGLSFYATIGLSISRLSEPAPELLLSVESPELAWGYSMGFVAAQARGKFGFEIGETIDFRAKIAPDSDMSAFLIVPQMMFPENYNTVELDDGVVELRQLVPLYDDEMKAIRTRGPMFFANQQPDVANVRRDRVALQ